MERTCEHGAALPEQAAAQADPDAVSALVERYGPEVLRLCTRYMGSRPDAEDALQETFLKIWMKLYTCRGRDPAAFRAWISLNLTTTCIRCLALMKVRIP